LEGRTGHVSVSARRQHSRRGFTQPRHRRHRRAGVAERPSRRARHPPSHRGRPDPGDHSGDRRLRQLHARGLTHGRTAGRASARCHPDRRTRHRRCAAVCRPLGNFAVSQHSKAWVDMAITDPRRAAATHPVLAGKPVVLVTVRGGSYRPGTPARAVTTRPDGCAAERRSPWSRLA